MLIDTPPDFTPPQDPTAPPKLETVSDFKNLPRIPGVEHVSEPLERVMRQLAQIATRKEAA